MKKLTCAQDTFTLKGDIQVPCIGYGTWQTPPEQTVEAVVAALHAGYRHIDTAWIYGNEAAVGEGIRKSGVARDEIFVATKHWVTMRGYKKTVETFEESLRNLGLSYLDLYLVHWPAVAKNTPNWEEVNADTWRGFERMIKDGKLRAAGVSNFEKKHLDALQKNAEILPAVNQIEFHPGYTQLDNVKDTQARGMTVEAWSPLGSGAVLRDETLGAIAAGYGKTTAQLCIRFALQCGVLPLPKSTSPQRMAQNLEVFDFTISDADMKRIKTMPELGFSTYHPEDAPADQLAGLV